MTATKSVEVSGTSLAFVERGRGEPLVLVHGSVSDYRSWGKQLETLSSRFHVVAYSRRYHFPNPWSGTGEDYSAALHAKDLAGFIEKLGLQPARIAASSFGGYVALVMAAERPDLVRSMALGEPPLFPWLADHPEGRSLLAQFQAEVWGPCKEAFLRGDSVDGVRRFLDGVLGTGVFDNLSPQGQSVFLDNAPEMKAEALATDIFSPFSREEARRLQVPVLLLVGECSPRILRLISDELAAALPLAERATIPQASHAMHTTNRIEYNQAVLRFFERH